MDGFRNGHRPSCSHVECFSVVDGLSKSATARANITFVRESLNANVAGTDFVAESGCRHGRIDMCHVGWRCQRARVFLIGYE